MGTGFVVDLGRPFVAVLFAAGEDGGEEPVDAVAFETGLRQVTVGRRRDTHPDAPLLHRLQTFDHGRLDRDVLEVAGFDDLVDFGDDLFLALRKAELVLHIEGHRLEEHSGHLVVLFGAHFVAETLEIAPADLDPQMHGLGQSAVHVEYGAANGHLLTFLDRKVLGAGRVRPEPVVFVVHPVVLVAGKAKLP